MQIILLENVDKLGRMGDKLDVACGYGRNFLIPRGKALRATKANIAYYDQKKADLEKANAEKTSEAEAIAKKLEGGSVTISRQAAEDGRLFGSVTSKDICNAIKDTLNVEIKTDQVILNHKFKEIGSYEVTVHIFGDVKQNVMLNISRVSSQETATIVA